MKAFMHGILALAVCALLSVSAFAGDKNKDKVHKSITFASDTMVSGTLVKAGDYELKFEQQTGEIEIVKGSKVIAKATGHLELRDAKANTTALRIISKDNMDELVAVRFGGSREELVIGSSSSVSGSQ